MRTTVTLDEKLIREVMKNSTARTKTAAVAQALQEHLRRLKLEKLRSLLGHVDIDADWETLRDSELEESERDRG
ncbi:MAG: type II toxin-antitoxin system VapB family antitoxin [Deltaproteobacteria bacterium]|nr:type II toxin-antitoxin system VapB family antitoxin [Deltaproteobacteria bacterium]